MKDMLKSYVLQFKGSWELHLLLAKFTYNNNYHLSIDKAPFKALYEKQYKTPLCGDEVGEKKMMGSEYVQMSIDKIKII